LAQIISQEGLSVTFSVFNLSPRLAAGVHALGYQEPTPIQRQSIPPIMAERDVAGLSRAFFHIPPMGIAETQVQATLFDGRLVYGELA
jgi:hypothetical protein